MENFEGFLFGLSGGSAIELLKWWNLRHELKPKGIPDWSKSWLYWIITVLMIFAGGFLVIVYLKSGAVLNTVLAVHIGASTPVILTGISRETPPILPGTID